LQDNGPFVHTEGLYIPLYKYAATWGGKAREVLFNSEWTTFEEVYLSNTSATMMAYEGYGSTIEATTTNPSKFDWSKYPRKRFAMCIENVTTAADAIEVVKKGVSLHFGSFFISSQTADYSILPAYWPEFVDFLRALNNGSVAPPPPAPHPKPAPPPGPPAPPAPPPCHGNDKTQCQPVVHYLINDRAELFESSGGCGIGPATVPLLSTETLVVTPAKYCFENQRYDLTAQGLYHFFDLDRNVSAQRIVFQVRMTPSWPRSWPTLAFYSCIPTGTHGPTCIFWANLTPFWLQDDLDALLSAVAIALDVKIILTPLSIFH
jgi:hypothetical protein